MDEATGPWGFLIGGAVFSALAFFMLSNASTAGEHLLGYSALWVGVVLTVAGAASWGVSSGSRR